MGAVQAALATISSAPLVEWPNRESVDLAQQTEPFIGVDFIVGDSLQKSLGTSNRVVRYFGMLTLTINVKLGAGLAVPTQLIDKFVLGLALKNFSGLQFEEVKPRQPLMQDGWHIQPLTVPFYFDDLL